ncbi:unnamed protein product, partial [Mesocestoides corti]
KEDWYVCSPIREERLNDSRNIFCSYRFCCSYSFDLTIRPNFKLVTFLLSSGYGHIVPQTQMGKVFCIFFACIGIPFTLYLSSRVSIAPNNLDLVDELRALQTNSASRARLVHFLCVVVLDAIVTMFLPAYIFMIIEPDWTYIDAIYFCFISLTTIGFGDLVPGGDNSHNPAREFYKIASIVYLLGGTTLLMLLVRVYGEMLEAERRAKRDRLLLENLPSRR